MAKKQILKLGIWSAIILIPITFFLIPYLITTQSWLWSFDGTTGVMGDTIGGITGPVIGFIGAFLTFIAFYIQYDANKLQEKALKDQEKQILQQQFESRFFELLQLHRDNVAEIVLQGEAGKKVFVTLIREFRQILSIFKKSCLQESVKLTKEDSLCLAYMVFFYGTGPNSNRVLRSSIPNMYVGLIEKFISELDDKKLKKRYKKERNFKFMPFEGHQSRLAHYYRHLYQTIVYIDESKLDINKYEYIKILRAQLSNHEQALLFFNSMSYLGQDWRYKGLIERYHFIRNLPENFIDPINEINITDVYPKVKFEYLEVRYS